MNKYYLDFTDGDLTIKDCVVEKDINRALMKFYLRHSCVLSDYEEPFILSKIREEIGDES